MGKASHLLTYSLFRWMRNYKFSERGLRKIELQMKKRCPSSRYEQVAGLSKSQKTFS